ncbi:winged helix-turn-helix transcriptional regulator [Prauserella endophytica]|uniref:Winged helix-turn-helix transcriptional regulator n=1 Tax=Prauserella endophytica TaxID=1592324 RepID=A0ABY2RWJ8_9PSEU|nr:winged helix-turn-helix transcriptional regulator [Prauserella endophytica]
MSLWRQVADDIRTDIKTGRLKPGVKLPSYPDLGDMYGVATLTIRRAVLELRKEGLLVVTVGRGTYVTHK